MFLIPPIPRPVVHRNSPATAPLFAESSPTPSPSSSSHCLISSARAGLPPAFFLFVHMCLTHSRFHKLKTMLSFFSLVSAFSSARACKSRAVGVIKIASVYEMFFSRRESLKRRFCSKIRTCVIAWAVKGRRREKKQNCAKREENFWRIMTIDP